MSKRLDYQWLGVGVLLIVLLLSVAYVVKNVALLLFSASSSLFIMALFCRKHTDTLVVAGSSVLALSFAEVISGAINDEQNSTAHFTDHYALYNARNTVYGSVPSKGKYAAGKKAGDEVIYSVNYTIGNDGFRVTPDQAEQHSKSRINFFGGSYTFGEGLNDDETLPYYTSRYLTGIEVKNYGMHGWGVHNALAILEILPSTTEGEVNVLLTGPWHALRSSCIQSWTTKHPKYELTEAGKIEYAGACGQYEFFAFNVGVESNFQIFSTILSKSSLVSRIRNAFSQPEIVTRKMLDLYLALISEIKIRSEQNGQKLVVGFIGGKEDRLADGITNSEVFDAISEISDAVVDLSLRDNMGKLPRHYYIHEKDRHPSAKANSERAFVLKPLLERLISNEGIDKLTRRNW